LEKYDIGLMYLYIRTKNGRFMDTREIDSDNLVSYARENDNQAMTDDVSVEEYEAFFADMLTRGEQLIHISMAKNVGKSYEAAMKAAQSFDHVTVVDSGQISCGQGMVALYAAKLAQEENTREEICEKVERMKKRVESGFLLSSAAAFGQSGYMNKNLAGVMDALRLHPVVKMSQSGMVCRGVMAGDMENCRKRFISRQLWKKRWINTDVISVSYAGFEVSQQNFVRKEITRRIPFAKVYMEKASVSNACTLGAGSLGMAYYRNVREE
jgi:DegV family protein with EDD domain